MNDNQPDSQPNDGTGKEILPLNDLPVIPPTLPPMDIIVGDADPVNEQVLPSDLPIQAAATPVRRVRMKFKDCGVQGNKSLFIRATKIDLYTDDVLPDTLYLDGGITSVPNTSKNIVDYDVRWQTNGLLPVSFDMDHLRTKFFKDNLQAMSDLRDGRKLYDLQYPHANGKGPRLTHQRLVRNATSTGLTVRTQSETNVNDVIEASN
jgi:hypothetical protein